MSINYIFSSRSTGNRLALGERRDIRGGDKAKMTCYMKHLCQFTLYMFPLMLHFNLDVVNEFRLMMMATQK